MERWVYPGETHGRYSALSFDGYIKQVFGRGKTRLPVTREPPGLYCATLWALMYAT